MPSRDPTFSDEQAREIFAAAAERESQADETLPARRGDLSLDDLKRIGGEAGIDPIHVEAAARALVRRSADLPDATSGSGRLVEVTRSLPVGPDDRMWERMVTTLRQEFRCTGVATRFGDTREWISSAEGAGVAAIEVRLEAEGDGGRLIVRQDRAVYRQIGTVFGLAFAGVGVVLAVLMMVGSFEASLMALPLSFLGAGLASWLGTRALLPWFEERQRARFDRSADRLELIARDAASGESGQARGEVGQGGPPSSQR
jgi:hypothetical protein